MDFNFGLFDNDPMLSTSLGEDELVMENFLAADDEAPFDMCLASPSPSPSVSSQPDVIYYSDSEGDTFHAPQTLDQDGGQDEDGKEEPKAELVCTRKSTRERKSQVLQIKDCLSSDDEDQVIFSNGKPKLYAEGPFKNPKQERARLNAINAKKNREKKKNENAKLQKEMDRLREKNVRMKKAMKRFELRAINAERELAAIKALLESANFSDLLKLVSGK